MPTLKDERDAASRRQLLSLIEEQTGVVTRVSMDELQWHCQVGEAVCLESVTRVLAEQDMILRRRPSRRVIILRPDITAEVLRAALQGEKRYRAPRRGRGAYKEFLRTHVNLAEEIGRCCARSKDRIMVQKMAYHAEVLRGLLREVEREIELLGDC